MQQSATYAQPSQREPKRHVDPQWDVNKLTQWAKKENESMTLGTPLDWRCLKLERKSAKLMRKHRRRWRTFVSCKIVIYAPQTVARHGPVIPLGLVFTVRGCDFSLFNTLANYTWVFFLPRLSDDTQRGESNTHTSAKIRRRRLSGKTKRSIEKMPHFLVVLFLFGLCSHFGLPLLHLLLRRRRRFKQRIS